MVTLFTIPKPMAAAAAVAQLNALRSWRALGDDVEILVFGDEPGVAEAAAAVAARHVPEIRRNDWGTPLVSDAFAAAVRLAGCPRLCYANTDMILLADLLEAVRGTRTRSLLIGRRVDLAVEEELSFDSTSIRRLRSEARAGRRGTERQLDYMVFPRGIDWQMPPFAVGRPNWDNWLLYKAKSLGLPVIDASRGVLAVHQSHGYEHVPLRSGESWQGPEAERNRELATGMGLAYGLNDATHVLMGRFLLPAIGPRHLKRRLRRHRVFGRGVARGEALIRG